MNDAELSAEAEALLRAVADGQPIDLERVESFARAVIETGAYGRAALATLDDGPFRWAWLTELATAVLRGNHKKGNRMSTRKDGLNLEKIPEDEPVFILRAQDMLGPELVREWAYRAQCEGAPIAKCDEARRIADAMEQWQISHRRKVPD